jgi:hypothetical protein
MTQSEPPRYSRRPFPAYRFVPGRTPHPTRDPAGHSYGHRPTPAASFDAERWYREDDYLYGVDLYNHGYWWEAHEAWESCWAAAGKLTPTGLFLQGLIQITAGCLKKHQGHTDAGRRLAQEGLDKFPLREHRFLGIELHSFRQSLLDFFAGNKREQPLIELTFPDDK